MVSGQESGIFIGHPNNRLACQLAEQGKPRSVSMEMSPIRQMIAGRSLRLCILALIALVVAALAHDASMQIPAAIIAIGAALGNALARVGYTYTPEQLRYYYWCRFRRNGNIVEIPLAMVSALEAFAGGYPYWTCVQTQAFFQRHAAKTYSMLVFLRRTERQGLPAALACMYVCHGVLSLAVGDFSSRRAIAAPTEQD